MKTTKRQRKATLKRLRMEWDKHPHQRLGQLLYNTLRPDVCGKLFSIPDVELIQEIKTRMSYSQRAILKEEEKPKPENKRSCFGCDHRVTNYVGSIHSCGGKTAIRELPAEFRASGCPDWCPLPPLEDQ